MSYPAHYKYTEQHEWLSIEGDIATVGITHHAQDALAQLLLGATLVVSEADAGVSGAEWAGTVMFTSSSGWDSRGDGVIAWSAVDAATVAVSISGASLAASGTGAVACD